MIAAGPRRKAGVRDSRVRMRGPPRDRTASAMGGTASSRQVNGNPNLRHWADPRHASEERRRKGATRPEDIEAGESDRRGAGCRGPDIVVAVGPSRTWCVRNSPHEIDGEHGHQPRGGGTLVLRKHAKAIGMPNENAIGPRETPCGNREKKAFEEGVG